MKITAYPDLSGFAPANSAWSAVDDDTYDGPGSLIGFGPTEEAAIDDLMVQIEDHGTPDLDPDRLREQRDERRRLEREP